MANKVKKHHYKIHVQPMHFVLQSKLLKYQEYLPGMGQQTRWHIMRRRHKMLIVIQRHVRGDVLLTGRVWLADLFHDVWNVLKEAVKSPDY